MNITLWMNGARYELTPYVNLDTINISQTIDSTLDSGSFTTIPMTKNALGVTIDLSRPIIRLSRVRIEIDNDTFEFLVEEPKVDKTGYDTIANDELYTHTVRLISLTALLQRRPIPDMAVTQGLGTLGLFVRSASEMKRADQENIVAILPGNWYDDLYINDQYRDPEFFTTALRVTDTDVTVPLTVTTQSTDTDVINGMIMVEPDRNYQVNMALSIWNIQNRTALGRVSSPEADVQISIYVGGILKQTEVIHLDPATLRYSGWWIFSTAQDIIPSISNVNRTYTIRAEAANQLVQIKVKTLGTITYDGPVGGSGGPYTDGDVVWLKTANLSINTKDETQQVEIYLDQVIDKVLSVGKIGKTPEFVQGQNTRARLRQIKSPDYMWKGYYMWDALNEIAGYVGALVTMNQRTNVNEWTQAAAKDYADALTRVEVIASPERFMDYLDWFYQNYPLGTVAKRFIAESYEFVEGSVGEWNEGKTYQWQSQTSLNEPFHYDVTSLQALPTPLTSGLKGRVTVRTWINASNHIADFGYIKPRVQDLPLADVSGKKAIITGFDLIASDYSEWQAAYRIRWAERTSLAAPYQYEITNVNQLPEPTSVGWRARLTTLAWEVKNYHTADYGFIFAKYADLPATQQNGKKAIVTGYDLIESNYSEWISTFQMTWVSKSALASPYTYDVHKYSDLPQPPSTFNLKARVRVPNWNYLGYKYQNEPFVADQGYIQATLDMIPFSSAIGKKAIVTGYNLIPSDYSEYQASSSKLNLTTPEFPNVSDVWYAMQNQAEQYFNDLGQAWGFNTIIRTDDGFGNLYFKLSPVTGDELKAYSLGSVTTSYYLSENISSAPRITVNVPEMPSIPDVWDSLQSQQIQTFEDLSQNAAAGLVIRTDDGLGNLYFKLQYAENGNLRYYESNVSFRYFETESYYIEVRVTVTVGEGGHNSDDVWAALQSQEPTIFNNLRQNWEYGLIIRTDDGFGNLYWKPALVYDTNFLYRTSDVQRSYYQSIEILAGNRVTVTVPELPNGLDVMEALKNQYPQYYADLEDFYLSGGMVRSDDGLGNAYWKLSEIGEMYAKVVESISAKPTVEFKFFDDMESQVPYDAPNEKSHAAIAYFEDYVNAIEINAENIIGDENAIKVEPYYNGWATLRAIEDGLAQITTQNLGYHTSLNIDKPRKILVKGIPVTTANHTFNASTVWDITERVLEKTYWDTLTNESAYTFIGRSSFNKNNTLYYVKGQNKIFNMSFTGTFEPQLIGQPQVIRALYEAVYAVATLQTQENVTSTDPGTTTADENVLIYIEYKQYSQSRMTIYKEDQTGFQTEAVKFYNETARVNEAKALGNYAQNIVNRMGGTNVSKTGITATIGEIPKIGQPNTKGQILVVRNIQPRNDHVLYSLNYVQDYAIISSYVDISSRLRQYEIPLDEMVLRIDKYREMMIFTDWNQYSDETSYQNVSLFLNVLKNLKTPGSPTYARIEYEHSDGSIKRVDVNVDVIAMGKTLSINVRMKDNFSAGIRKYTTVVGGVTQKWQEDVQYADVYGRASQIKVDLYVKGNTTSVSRMNSYPLSSFGLGNTMISSLAYELNKDAREITALAQEMTFLTESNSVVIYSGFARFNPLALPETATYNIKSAVLNYRPGKNSTIVDLNKIIADTVGVNIVGNRIDITTTQTGQGVVWYEENTLELIMVVFMTGTSKSIYYKIRR
ncbi:MAG: hypothetical protein M0Q00_00410 [Acholeplasmataceae bacterium]|nr:hypothetical protein [Acholeplasmataceae bacterium]